MQNLAHISISGGQLVSTVIMIALSAQAVLAQDTSSERTRSGTLLSTLRTAVLANEARASVIRMEYRWTNKVITDDPSEPPQKGTHVGGLYAQDGNRIHSTLCSYDGEQMLHGDVRVIDGEVYKRGVLPDLMQGDINQIEKFNLGGIAPLMLGLRPVPGQFLLSQLLVPERASIRQEHAMIEGRDCAVIRVELSLGSAKGRYRLMWIDRERALPLRMELYQRDETGGSDTRIRVTESTKLHQLPNGGWIPVEGTDRLQGRRGDYGLDVTKCILVDVNSISIEKKDIPDSLFDIQFPPGARVWNMIVGAFVPGEFDLINSTVQAILNETPGEILASLSQKGKGSTPQEESSMMAAADQNDTPVAKSDHPPMPETVQAANASISSWKPLMWISACISVLVFGASGVVHCLRSDSKRRVLP